VVEDAPVAATGIQPVEPILTEIKRQVADTVETEEAETGPRKPLVAGIAPNPIEVKEKRQPSETSVADKNDRGPAPRLEAIVRWAEPPARPRVNCRAGARSCRGRAITGRGAAAGAH
jgi:hypothetical protein